MLARFASGVAGGVVLTATLTIVDVAAGSAPLSGRAVDLWHCDRDGNDSMCSQAATRVRSSWAGDVSLRFSRPRRRRAVRYFPEMMPIRVLYVEDDERLARLTSEYLASHDVEVHVLARTEDTFDRSIDIIISGVRAKLEEDPKNPQILKTIRGAGYMLTSGDP